LALQAGSSTTTLTFDRESKMVEAIARVAATLPKELRESLAFGNGEVQVLQVVAADTRRNDVVFSSAGKVYGVEFKRGILTEADIYEALILRRYSIILKTRYGDKFAGIVFVGETVETCLSPGSDSGIRQTWMELTGCGITAVKIGDFARTIITKSLNDVADNPGKYSPHTICQIPAQLHALTTTSDGYPQWFNADWLIRTLDDYSSVLGEYCKSKQK